MPLPLVQKPLTSALPQVSYREHLWQQICQLTADPVLGQEGDLLTLEKTYLSLQSLAQCHSHAAPPLLEKTFNRLFETLHASPHFSRKQGLHAELTLDWEFRVSSSVRQVYLAKPALTLKPHYVCRNLQTETA